MLPPLFLTLLQNSINRYLRLDANACDELAPLSGRVIRLKITVIDATIFFKIIKKEIHLLDEHAGPIDASLTGSPLALLRTWMETTPDKAVIPEDIIITGDLHLIQTLNSILRNCDIDWEKQLSPFLGDTIAQKVGEFFGSMSACFSQKKSSLSERMRACLHEEKNVLPKQKTVDDFCKEVDKLREDVDRAEVRLNQFLDDNQ